MTQQGGEGRLLHLLPMAAEACRWGSSRVMAVLWGYLLLGVLSETVRGGEADSVSLSCDMWGLGACLVDERQQTEGLTPCDEWARQVQCFNNAGCLTNELVADCIRLGGCWKGACSRAQQSIGATLVSEEEWTLSRRKGLYDTACPPGFQHCGLAREADGTIATTRSSIGRREQVQPYCVKEDGGQTSVRGGCGAKALLPAMPADFPLNKQGLLPRQVSVQDISGNVVLQLLHRSSKEQAAKDAEAGSGSPRYLLIRSPAELPEKGLLSGMVAGQLLVSGVWGIFMAGPSSREPSSLEVVVSTNIAEEVCENVTGSGQPLELYRVLERGLDVAVESKVDECSSRLIPGQCACRVAIQRGGVVFLAQGTLRPTGASGAASVSRRTSSVPKGAVSGGTESQGGKEQVKAASREGGRSSKSIGKERETEAEAAMLEQTVKTAPSQPQPQVQKVPLRNKVVVALAVCAFVANGGFLIYVFWMI